MTTIKTTQKKMAANYLLLLLSFVLSCANEPPDFDPKLGGLFGGRSIRLGMPKDSVMNSFSELHKLTYEEYGNYDDFEGIDTLKDKYQCFVGFSFQGGYLSSFSMYTKHENLAAEELVLYFKKYAVFFEKQTINDARGKSEWYRTYVEKGDCSFHTVIYEKYYSSYSDGIVDGRVTGIEIYRDCK